MGEIVVSMGAFVKKSQEKYKKILPHGEEGRRAL